MMFAVLLASPVHGSSSLAAFSLVIFLLILRCSAMDLSSLEAVIGQAVRESLLLAGITEEQAADLMQMDLSALRKCLRGEGRLQLGVARLLRLPFGFWLRFSPSLMYLVAKQHASQIADDLGIKTGGK